MKILSLLVLSSAGAWLGYVALHAPEPDYTPPTLRVPVRIETEAEPGQTMRAFEVEGMCCESCTHKLYRSLLAVEGVSEAAVDFESARAWALARVEVPVARLLTALHFDKYSASVRE